ncbi:MAG: hypothetical protein NE327_17565 [Lentisphaeraceae bacterium]|nr:hypothetical protein [Lentisphaeraceae bacterium]
MHKYFDLVIKGWFVLNNRKKGAENIPLFLIAASAILQALACWIIAEFFFYFFSDSVTVGSSSMSTGINFGTSLVAAIAIVAALGFMDRGKNLSSLSWFGDFLGKWQESKYEESGFSQNYNVIIVNVVLLCKTVCLASLISRGQTFWIIPAVALSYSGMIASMSKAGLYQRNEDPDIETFTTTGVFSILICLFHPHFIPTIMVIILAFFGFKYLFKFFIKKFEHMNEQMIRSITEIIQCILIISGLLFIR